MNILRTMKAPEKMEGIPTGTEIAIIKETGGGDQYGSYVKYVLVANYKGDPKPIWDILPKETIKVYDDGGKQRDFSLSLKCSDCPDFLYNYYCKRRATGGVRGKDIACTEFAVEAWRKRQGKKTD